MGALTHAANRRSRLRRAALTITALALTMAVGSGAAAASDKKKDAKQVKSILFANQGQLNVNHANTAGFASSAGSANSVKGVGLVKIFALVPGGSSGVTIMNFNGFTITAACGPSLKAIASFTTPGGGSFATAQGNTDNNGAFESQDDSTTGSSTVDLTDQGAGFADGSSTFGGAAGSASVSGVLAFKPQNETYVSNNCGFVGHAVG
jgi:hypothetical protein